MLKTFKYIIACCSVMLCALNTNAQQLLFTDNFDYDLSNWIAEFENEGNSSMEIIDGKLAVSSSGGATVWFRHKLSGNLIISFTGFVVDACGKNDRVSDMNCFWMATDPANENMFTRDGRFSSYDNLSLYYAGIGGHHNTTTRFRKYHADGNKPVIKEYLDADYLLAGNKTYSVQVVVNNNLIEYYVDDVLYWSYCDSSPLKEGYFGFRTYKSHQYYSDFKVIKIQ